MRRQTLRRGGLALALVVLAGITVAVRAAEKSSGTTWLGVYSQVLTPELRDAMDYRGEGLLVSSVVPDSPAERAGVVKGDIIVSIDQQMVDSPDALARTIIARRPGDLVSIKIVRDGASRRLSARLVAREATPDATGIQGSGHDSTGSSADPQIEIRSQIEGGSDSTEIDSLNEKLEPMLHDIDGDVRVLVSSGRGRLGVRAQDLNKDLGEYFGADKGALVMEVLDDTPAKRAGIKAGDVITRVDGDSVENASDLTGALRGKTGDITIEFLRRGARNTAKATLEARKTTEPKWLAMRGGHPRRMVMWNDGGSGNEEMRKELSDLRKEIEQLRMEMNTMKQEK